MFEILKSIILTVIISTIISWVCYYYFDVNYIGSFVLTIIIQLSLSWYIKTYTNSQERLQALKVNRDIITQLDKEATQAPCAHCGAINLIPISPDQDNDFTCEACNKPNSVYVNITVAQPTVPIDSTKYEVTQFNSTGLNTARDEILKNDE